jgi:hypothetical protein
MPGSFTGVSVNAIATSVARCSRGVPSRLCRSPKVFPFGPLRSAKPARRPSLCSSATLGLAGFIFAARLGNACSRVGFPRKLAFFDQRSQQGRAHRLGVGAEVELVIDRDGRVGSLFANADCPDRGKALAGDERSGERGQTRFLADRAERRIQIFGRSALTAKTRSACPPRQTLRNPQGGQTWADQCDCPTGQPYQIFSPTDFACVNRYR